MPEEINVFALFNSLKRDGAVRISDCSVNKVGRSMDAAAEKNETKENEQR